MGMAVSVPRYTVDDLEHFPDDGARYELLDGLLLVTPGPSAAHQNAASQLHGLLFTAVQRTGHARVVSPGAISVPPRNHLQPDILVYPARFGPSVNWKDIGEHWLAVEILSRSSRIYDREFKRDAYFVFGVPEVWLVDIRGKSAEVSRSPGDHQVVRDTIRWRVPTLDLVVPIDLATVFAGLE